MGYFRVQLFAAGKLSGSYQAIIRQITGCYQALACSTA
jgi:hypothetical protein